MHIRSIVFGGKELWLASESNYLNFIFQFWMCHNSSLKNHSKWIKPQKSTHNNSTTKMIGFESRNNVKPCYWKCVDTFVSAATTFYQNDCFLCTKQKDRILRFLFLSACCDSKNWNSSFLFLSNEFFFFIFNDNLFNSEAVVWSKQVKCCTFISEMDFILTFSISSIFIIVQLNYSAAPFHWLIILVQKAIYFSSFFSVFFSMPLPHALRIKLMWYVLCHVIKFICRQDKRCFQKKLVTFD